MTDDYLNEIKQFAEDRPTSTNDDLYDWAVSAEGLLYSLVNHAKRQQDQIKQAIALNHTLLETIARQPSTQPLTADRNEFEAFQRQAFEDAAWALYQQKLAAGQLDAQREKLGDNTREALFWKQSSGEYGVLHFNSAWWGWKAAKGMV